MTPVEKIDRIRALCKRVDACELCPVVIWSGSRCLCPFARPGVDILPAFGSWDGPSDWARADEALAKLDAAASTPCLADAAERLRLAAEAGDREGTARAFFACAEAMQRKVGMEWHMEFKYPANFDPRGR